MLVRSLQANSCGNNHSKFTLNWPFPIKIHYFSRHNHIPLNHYWMFHSPVWPCRKSTVVLWSCAQSPSTPAHRLATNVAGPSVCDAGRVSFVESTCVEWDWWCWPSIIFESVCVLNMVDGVSFVENVCWIVSFVESSCWMISFLFCFNVYHFLSNVCSLSLLMFSFSLCLLLFSFSLQVKATVARLRALLKRRKIGTFEIHFFFSETFQPQAFEMLFGCSITIPTAF